MLLRYLLIDYFRNVLILLYRKYKSVKKISYFFFSYKMFLKTFSKPMPLRHPLTFSQFLIRRFRLVVTWAYSLLLTILADPTILTKLLKAKPGFLMEDLSILGEIIESSDGPRHLSTISLKNFKLFKIAKSVINFCLKKFSNQQF